MAISVLIIDSNQDLLETLTGALSLDDKSIISTNQAEEYIDLIKTLLPDIVLLDISLPELDGFDVCRKIREISKIPILVLSASSSTVEAIRLLDYGADDFLQKPINPQVLEAHINNLIRRSKLACLNKCQVIPNINH